MEVWLSYQKYRQLLDFKNDNKTLCVIKPKNKHKTFKSYANFDLSNYFHLLLAVQAIFSNIYEPTR